MAGAEQQAEAPATTLACEVQSPGFSSHLSSLVARQREEEEAWGLSLQQARTVSRLGNLPRVQLSERQLPKLTSSNSEMFYSPFPRYSGQGAQHQGTRGTDRQGRGGELRPHTGYSSSC